MEKYIKYLKRNNYSINTIKTYKSILKNYNYELRDIRLVKNKLIDKSKSPNTIHLHYNVLSSYLKWKNDKRFNQLKSLKLPPIPLKYMEVFSKNFLEKKTKINNNDTDQTKIKKYTIKFLFETGIRAEELKSILNVNKDTLTILGKGNKIREVFYKNDTYLNLKKFDYSTKTLRIWVKEVLGENYTPHSIRRSHATHLLLNGANPKSVMMQLGHAKIETTFRYLQLNLKENKKQYDKFF